VGNVIVARGWTKSTDITLLPPFLPVYVPRLCPRERTRVQVGGSQGDKFVR